MVLHFAKLKEAKVAAATAAEEKRERKETNKATAQAKAEMEEERERAYNEACSVKSRSSQVGFIS